MTDLPFELVPRGKGTWRGRWAAEKVGIEVAAPAKRRSLRCQRNGLGAPVGDDAAEHMPAAHVEGGQQRLHAVTHVLVFEPHRRIAGIDPRRVLRSTTCSGFSSTQTTAAPDGGARYS